MDYKSESYTVIDSKQLQTNNMFVMNVQDLNYTNKKINLLYTHVKIA